MNTMDGLQKNIAKHINIFILVSFGIVLLLDGCATVKPRDAQYQFKSYIGEKGFPPRDKQTGISSQSGSELLEKGYMPIGNIKVVQPADRPKKVDPATKAQMIASGLGGDLITFSVHNEERVEVKKKKTKCLKKKKQLMLVWDPMVEVDLWREIEECVEWEYESKKIKVTESVGIIWRLEPKVLNQKAGMILFKVIEENKPDLARTLLEKVDINVNTRDRFDWTPLMFAAYYGGEGNLELARYLIQKGAYVQAKDSNGKTALMKAVEDGNMDIAKLLIISGADIKAVDRDNKTALDLATDENRKKIEKWIKNGK
jgi:hypothetical protein